MATLAFGARLLARTQLINGQWRAARATLAESLDNARISGQINQQLETLGTLAWLDAAQGRAEECRRNVDEAQVLADSVNLRWRNDLLRALVLLELGVGVVSRRRSSGFAARSAIHRFYATRQRTQPRRSSSRRSCVWVTPTRRLSCWRPSELLAPFADEAERTGQAFPQAVPFVAVGCSQAKVRTTASSSARSSSTPATRTFSRLRARGWHTASGSGGAAGGSTRASS